MFPDHINTTIYHYADARIHYYNYFSNKFKEKPLENKIIFVAVPERHIILKAENLMIIRWRYLSIC